VEEVGRLIREMSEKLPESKRDAFIEQMSQRVDMVYIKDVMLDGLVAGLTATELRAAATFYRSPEGKAIRQKLPQVIDGITPLIQNELTRTTRRLSW
jgi:hypothetical protein